MKTIILRIVLLVVLLMLGLSSASAQGIIVPPVGGVFTDPSWLKIAYQRVTVDVENQIARTNIDMAFINTGEALAEGTFIFPLPLGAAVDQLVMYINGEAIQAKILSADEARGIYNEIVRQYRDPALLEYLGTGAIQANVFPIPPGETRRIQIGYSQVLEVDNGLFHYVYPLHTGGASRRMIESMSISVNVKSSDPISSIYSPTHNIAITRSEDNKQFRVGYEGSMVVPETDFGLYYGVANETINVNLLTYRESASEDGFFMLLVQPPVTVKSDEIVPKDVIIVLDQSGSMSGIKWTQAQDAAAYVLRNLNPNDRFNVIAFSTGWRLFSRQLAPVGDAGEAISWIRGLLAEGGTDINGALTTALEQAQTERPTTILFMTDGLATEGEIDSRKILQNLKQAAKPNVRVFTFGVGDDVDTLLLDAIVRDHRGTSSYVRPGERIDEEVASLYNKISAPVLNDIALDFGGMQVELLYPAQLPDLFAGEQLTLVGRYRGGNSSANITLSGSMSGSQQNFVYSGLRFSQNAGGEAFIARLWATRRIGDLLNTIRLNGENPELVQSIVNLSLRYGIITPYTSFLIEEDDILSQQARDRALESVATNTQPLAMTSGSAAVDAADLAGNLAGAAAPAPLGGAGGGGYGYAEPLSEENEQAEKDLRINSTLRTVGSKTFVWQDGKWMDTLYTPDTMQTEKVTFLSDAYFALLAANPALGDYFALGEQIIVVFNGIAYEVVSA